ncbi:Glutathione-disulfide reductase [Paramicrosporidium saccamoebae]|uniref:Glutathione reductase n=1 Tax=Paramicrosporidium saccamoebae TaxID=1246581 RepID=A0A2H9TQJ1_9FUNG|nr:Glutathione-disulfide reductase [Paramicrosporidium saccamoebae]
MTIFDLAVIGGGSGGLAAARRAARYGARVVLVELSRLGGTCVNLGCVPKKLMYNAASLADSRIEARSYAFKGVEEEVDWPVLVERRDAYIRRLNSIYESNLAKDGVTVMQGRASFKSRDTIIVQHGNENTEVQAKHVIIATGSTAETPNVSGKELGITSDGFFALRKKPKKVGIVGSGYVGVELAGVLHSLGSATTLWCRRDGVLSHFDHMLSETVTSEMQRVGIDIRTMSQVKEVRKGADGKLVVCFTQSNGSHECHGYDSLIWAVGRRPNTGGLNLESAGVTVDETGHIKVDDYQNTMVEGIYALGDVTGPHPLTPVAVAAGRKLSDRLFGGQKDAKMDYEGIPSVVFSHPAPCGTIGISEKAARAQYPNVKIYETSFTNLYYALMETEQKCRTKYKLICVGEEERVVGLHMVGRASDEILQGFAVAFKMGACKRDFDRCVAIHPTAAEELVTMT